MHEISLSDATDPNRSTVNFASKQADNKNPPAKSTKESKFNMTKKKK